MYLFDTFTNFLSGLGVVGRDKMTAFRYTKQIWTRDQLEASFQSDWIARKAIVIPAHDATREWRSWQAEADQIESLEATEDRLHVQLKLQEALTKARLYGGACLLIGVDGDMAMELDPTKIGKDALKFLHVLCPHQLVVQDLVKDIASPYYGQPEFYTLNDDTGKFGSVKIHPSRMVRLIGLDPPDPMQNWGWGDPFLQVINDAVSAAGTVQQSVAAMIGEAKFDVVKIPGLTEIFSTTTGTERLIKRFSEANVAKSVINAVVLDGEEEWQRIGVNFAGMPEVLQMYLQIAAGAADIPVTRFAGMSPSGLNSTGESDLQNYYDRIHADQELRLTPALEKLDIALQCSALGKFDDNIFYEWNSLWQMSEAEKATIAKQKADSAMVDVNSGLIPFEALVKGRVNQLIEDGTYPGIEAAIEEAIENAELMEEEQAAMMAEQQAGGLPGEEEEDPEGGGAPPNGFGGPQKALPPPKPSPERMLSHSRDSGNFLWWHRDAKADYYEGKFSRGQPENAGQFGPGGYSAGSEETKASRSAKATSALATKAKPSQVAEMKGAGTPAKLSVAGQGYKPDAPDASSYSFVSPSTKTGMNLRNASVELESRQQATLRAASADINQKVGINDASEVNVIGAWIDSGTKEPTAENSVMMKSNSASWDQLVLAGVMKAHLADQKAVLVFKQQDDGITASLSQFEAKGKLEKIHKDLIKAGLENHTLVPTDDGARVYILDTDGSLIDQIEAGAKKYGSAIHTQFGKGEFIPADSQGETDRQQRDYARSVYETYVAESAVEGASETWTGIRDRWSAPTDARGYDLTSAAILAEQKTAVKPNSVLLGQAAKQINDRAGTILMRDLGVDHLNLKNRTPEFDNYIADTIVLDLKAELASGESGEHWYNDTMKEAMSVAEKIYPGLSQDPNAQFAYTSALAITSQGEVVDRSTELADTAYAYFLEHKKFPENMEAADPNIAGNFAKMNKLINQFGVDGTRKFFDTQMTVAELEKQTGYSMAGMNVGDVVYGSGYLGPKIGQGFYQNLNGNFEPITMDMWFMRSWGRITNTGIERGDFKKQLDTFTNALDAADMPIPKTREKKIELAHEIADEHEKKYQKYKDEYKSGKRVKTAVVKAAERVVIYDKHALVDQPKNGNDRKWMDEVMHIAIDKLAKEGVNVSPASAQAIWWWPEKLLWERMGVRAKENDTDYAKSLRKLAAKKGIAV